MKYQQVGWICFCALPILLSACVLAACARKHDDNSNAGGTLEKPEGIKSPLSVIEIAREAASSEDESRQRQLYSQFLEDVQPQLDSLHKRTVILALLQGKAAIATKDEISARNSADLLKMFGLWDSDAKRISKIVKGLKQVMRGETPSLDTVELVQQIFQYRESSEWGKAITLMKQLAEQDPDNPTHWFELGRTLAMDGPWYDQTESVIALENCANRMVGEESAKKRNAVLSLLLDVEDGVKIPIPGEQQ